MCAKEAERSAGGWKARFVGGLHAPCWCLGCILMCQVRNAACVVHERARNMAQRYRGCRQGQGYVRTVQCINATAKQASYGHCQSTTACFTRAEGITASGHMTKRKSSRCILAYLCARVMLPDLLLVIEVHFILSAEVESLSEESLHTNKWQRKLHGRWT